MEKPLSIITQGIANIAMIASIARIGKPIRR
jgi:hypothetical protein